MVLVSNAGETIERIIIFILNTKIKKQNDNLKHQIKLKVQDFLYFESGYDYSIY